MKPEQGILVPKTLKPIGQGARGDAHYAIVNIGGRSQRCVVKHINPQEIAVECFCALLGHHLSLPVLIPVVVLDPRDQSLWFGSRDVGYPSLAKQLKIGDKANAAQLSQLRRILSSWAQAPAVISFDEVIANGDRNPGNVLWDGRKFTIIDHECAVGMEPMKYNKLALYVARNLPAKQLPAIQTGVTASALAHQSLLPSDSPIWDSIKSEFLTLPASIGANFAIMYTMTMGRIPSLVSNAVTAVSPLFSQGQL